MVGGRCTKSTKVSPKMKEKKVECKPDWTRRKIRGREREKVDVRKYGREGKKRARGRVAVGQVCVGKRSKVKKERREKEKEEGAEEKEIKKKKEPLCAKTTCRQGDQTKCQSGRLDALG